jgi:hypothetical protein
MRVRELEVDGEGTNAEEGEGTTVREAAEAMMRWRR